MFALLAIAIGFGVVTKLGLLAIAPPENVSYFWPASGFLLAVLAVMPRSRWPAVLAVVFPTGVLMNVMGAGRGLVPSLGYALADVLEAFPAALLLARSGQPDFRSLRQVLALVVGAAPISALLSGAVGAAVATRFGADGGYFANLRTWVLSVVISDIVVTPLCVTWWQSARRGVSSRDALESALVIVLLAAVAGYVLAAGSPWPLIFLSFPIALSAAFRLGPRGAALASFGFAITAVFLARNGITPFTDASSMAHRVQWMQGLIGTLSVSSLALAATIEERKVTDARLRDADERNRTILEAAPIGIVLTARDGVILQANAAFCELLGRPIGAIVGHTYLEFTHPNDREHDVGVVGELLRGERNRATFEKRYVHADGSIRSTIIHLSPVRDEQGNISNAIAVVEDISRRRLLEEQLLQAQKLEAVGKLAGGVAHDFNNLLTVILSQSEIVGRRMIDPSLKEALADVNDAAKRGAGLTRQLLAFARKQVVEPRNVDLNALLGDMTNLLRRLVTENVVLRFEPTPGLFPVRIDPSQFEQIVVNLAVNARDAMPAGGKLTIRTANVSVQPDELADVGPGDWALFAISDTGEGMDDEVRQRVFEPFFTTKERGRGTGLGLATVHGIVAQSNGRIAVTSERGRGTTFRVWLPRVFEQSAVAPIAAAAMRSDASATVLVVEDERAVRRVACDVLQTRGYRVLEAADAEAALAIARDHDGAIDLVITDVIMPGKSGRELVDELLQRRPALHVLFTSGYTDDLIERHGVTAPAASFLQKPYAPTDLIEKVSQTLDVRSRREV